MDQALTATQRRVLQFIADFKRENESMPTRADIGRHFGWVSYNSADTHIKALERKEMLSRVSGRSRGLRLTFKGIGFLGLAQQQPSPFPLPVQQPMLRLPVYDPRRLPRGLHG